MRKRAKNWFIPHEGNGYKPDLLQRFSAGVMFLLVLLSFTFANLQALLWIASDWMVSTVLPSVLIELTNEERNDQSLQMLSMSEKLTTAANLKAQHMAEGEYFAHYSPDGVSPWYWFDQASYPFVHAGENLAVHFTDSEDVVEAWMESPAHRANIMNGNFTEIGIGTAKGQYKGFPTVFVVQLFGTPAVPTEPATPAVLAVESVQAQDITLETEIQEEGTTEGTESVAPITFETIPIDDAATEISEENTSPEDIVVVYSDLATTSREGVAAPLFDTDGGVGQTDSPLKLTFAKSLLIPGVWLQLFYGVLASLVVVTLLLSIMLEWKRHHPVQIAYGTGLLAVMALLLYVHSVLTAGVTIV